MTSPALPDIVRVAEALGLPIARRGGMAYIPCPARGHERDDQEPRCSLGGNKNAAHCFKCQWAADPVGLVKAVKGLSTRYAFEWLRQCFPELREVAPDRTSQKPVDELAARRGWSAAVMRSLGAEDDGKNVRLPMRDAQGSVTGHKLRRGDGGEIMGHKSHTDKGGKSGLFYVPPLAEGPALVTEGEADTIAALTSQWPAVVGTAGAGPGPVGRQALQQLLAGRECILCPDPGESGRKWLAQVGQLLANAQCHVRFIPADAQHDLDERLRHEADKPGALAALVRTAMPWREDAQADATQFACTDSGNAELFALLYGDGLRYDHKRGRWLMWAGHWWTPDPDGALQRMSLEVARRRLRDAAALEDKTAKATHAKWALATESRKSREALLVLARSEHPIADSGDEWDTDPWLLGVANGVVDLRTGELGRSLPDQRVTIHTATPFFPAAKCQRWMRFLEEVFCGDPELVDFVWRAVGYSLTAYTYEQCLFVCYGTGANGKSVMLQTLCRVLGDYVCDTPFTTFELKQRQGIPNDVAALADKRLVTSSETNEGTRLNEARVKAMTGGDLITARFLHCEFFSFTPRFKVWLAVNHKPVVRDDSHGFWRRVRLIPFLRQFDADADRFLGQVLAEEAAGILAWAVRGCLAWQRQGLDPPEAVAAATERYRQESDPLADYVAERCTVGAEFSAQAGQLYGDYRQWAEAQGFGDREILSGRKFGERMSARYERREIATGRVYFGIGLRSS